MENIISLINTHIELKNIISCFSYELLLFLGIFTNLFLLFFRKKINIRKVSKILTISTFGIGILAILITSIINFGGYNFTLLYDYFEPAEDNVLLKILINLFMIFFILTNYENIKKFSLRVPVLNSILLALALCGELIIRSESYIITYLLLETIAILVYKFASNMRIKKLSAFSIDYIILSASATVIFLAFYILGLNTDKTSQISIINLCLSIAVLMKIGIFPFYNFLTLKQAKTNLAFSLLLFGYLPWAGVLAFNKMAGIIMPSDEIYQLSMIAFVIVSLVTFSLYASKYKNMIKFLANFSYFINGLCILSVVYFQSNLESIWLSTTFTFAFMGLYSLLNILKSNFKLNKIYVASLQGIFLNNRLFAFLFSGILISMTGLVPGGIMNMMIKTLKNIYIYDKTGFLTVCAVVCLLILILFNSLKTVQSIYTFNKSNIIPALTKRTTLNYVVPVVVLLFLLIKTVL